MFTINLDWVVVRKEVVRGVLLCVQDFVTDPVFTQRNFFSETGVTMPSEAAAISDRITSSSLYASWSEVESKSLGQVIGDLKTSLEKALDCGRVFKNTNKQVYALSAVRPWSGEVCSNYGVRISTVVEEGQVEYLPVVPPSRKIIGPSRHHSSPVKGKKKVSRSPVKLPHQFEVWGPSASSQKRAVVKDSTFSALGSQFHRGTARRSGRDRKAASVSHGGSRNRICFVWASITALSPRILLLFCHLPYETVFFSSSLYFFYIYIVVE